MLLEDFYSMNSPAEMDMDLLAQLFSESPALVDDQLIKERRAAFKSETDFYGDAPEMALKTHGDAVLEEEQQWSDPFVVEYGNQPYEGSSPNLPAYLMAGAIMSPIPDVEYNQGVTVKQEPFSPDNTGDVQYLRYDKPPLKGNDGEYRSSSRSRSKKGQKGSGSTPLIERHHKRLSDEDDGDSVSSYASETFTDGTDAGSGSDPAMSPTSSTARLPSLPRIPTVAFPETAKRQRRDVSMSAPAVAARELRQKKKYKEEQLIQECNDLKVEAEGLDKEMAEARQNLAKLREDALYLRSLVRSQHSTVQLLEYLQKAPFFNKAGSALKLDARSMLRQISGGDSEKVDGDGEEEKKDIGGICLHINGAEISLHLCSHCSTEASKKLR
ncbi:hypothetical protein RvY_16878 [Ramazzottius varieornatus]|uniref:BZIP domain-containing protein n=1 Tax=Ramazzottius varieornatus TaxID=947166 RepID=A0A1D1W6A4_RAMVA|nr:hypothetical protein RvY_16878 [Ramazzottius varieornatus]